MNKSFILSVLRIHNDKDYAEYLDCVEDLLENESVQSMEKYIQHHGAAILKHSLCVSYYSFRYCRERGLDYRSAARAGLLHDFFLYQRRVNKPYRGLHALGHPRVALENAEALFEINEVERDIIAKHMWPLCAGRPHYKETLVVSMMDKYCTVTEVFNFNSVNQAQIIQERYALQGV